MKNGIKLLSPRELSEKSGINTQTLYYLVRTHSLPHYRIGKKILISEEDFRNFLGQHRQEASQQ